MKYRILFFLFSAFSLSSCIKDEALNMEADILSVNASDDVFLLDPIISNTSVTLYLKPNQEDISKLKIDFKLTEGATIALSKEDFVMPGVEKDTASVVISKMQKDGVFYKVTSQDKQYTKKYLVRIVNTKGGFVPTTYGFEEFDIDQDNKFTVFYNSVDGHRFYNWASGNASFSLTLMISGQKPEANKYPTKTTNDAHSGETAVLLETLSTGGFGAAFKKPIAAGNLFIGSFDTGPVLEDPLAATQFGMPFNQVPVALEGYYKYVAGAQVTDSNLKPVDTKDSCDIYAVLYNRKELLASTSNVGKLPYLTGHNILNDPSVVAVARIKDGGATAGSSFTKFNLPFVYRAPIDEIAIAGLDYNIAIVMSSSKYGDSFIGAIGSKLIVDDIKIVTK